MLTNWDKWIEEVDMKRKVTSPFELKAKVMVSKKSLNYYKISCNFWWISKYFKNKGEEKVPLCDRCKP